MHFSAFRFQLLKMLTFGVSRIEEEILGSSFWAIGFGCWSIGNMTDEMVNEYL